LFYINNNLFQDINKINNSKVVAKLLLSPYF
jgi:hypothetical protein